jgi:hypothetical protein
MKKAKKIIAILLIITMCLPFVFSCGEKGDNNTAKATEDPGTDAAVTDAPPTDPPPPTEPPTEKPTVPPTEAPTDPASLSAPDVIGKTDTSDGYEIIPGARYYLWSPNSNLYLTVDGDYKGAGFTQEDYTGKAEQMFVFEKVREDVKDDKVTIIYRIRALGTKDGYLDVEDDVLERIANKEEINGILPICAAEPMNEGSQEWVLKAQKKTAIKDPDDSKVTLDDFADISAPLFSVTSVIAKSRVLDVSGVSTNSGGLVHLWAGGTANNQKWFFELVSDVESGKIVPRGKQELKY